jgi:hypothetical protein
MSNRMITSISRRQLNCVLDAYRNLEAGDVTNCDIALGNQHLVARSLAKGDWTTAKVKEDLRVAAATNAAAKVVGTACFEAQRTLINNVASAPFVTDKITLTDADDDVIDCSTSDVTVMVSIDGDTYAECDDVGGEIETVVEPTTVLVKYIMTDPYMGREYEHITKINY